MLVTALAGLAAWVVFKSPPREQGFWIFKQKIVPFEYLAAVALLIASAYIVLLALWYRGTDFCTRRALFALALCGALSVLWSQALFLLFQHLSLVQVESGWWIS